MDYKIIRATAQIGQIEVAYLADGKVVGVYAIDVPVIDGAFLTGDALEAEIQHRAPTWATTREQEVRAATGFEQIEALVEPLPTPAIDEETEANNRMWEQTQFEQRVAAVLVKFGVLQSDPTTIPVEFL